MNPLAAVLWGVTAALLILAIWNQYRLNQDLKRWRQALNDLEESIKMEKARIYDDEPEGP